MSFILQHLRLFQVTLEEHPAGPSLQSLSFAPTNETQSLLNDHQLIFRSRSDGFDVYYRTNPLASDPLLGRITRPVRFSFDLLLTESDFYKRYNPDLIRETGPQLYLDNLTPTGNIQAKMTLTSGDFVKSDDAMQAYPPVFFASADVSGGGAPTQYTVRDKFNPGNTVLQVPITGGPHQALTRIDLSDELPGPYTLETDAAGASPKTIYVRDLNAGSRIHGVLDIHWKAAQDTAPPGGVAHFIRFQKR